MEGSPRSETGVVELIFLDAALLLRMDRGRNKEREKPLVYVKEGCPYCKEAIDYLTDRKVPYTTVEVSKNGEALEELRKQTGQTKTPTMLYRHDVLRDFGLHELKGFLDKHKLD